jgi:AmmeMemoRadiSam system protein A
MPSLFEARPAGSPRQLSVAEQQALLQYARQGIMEAVCSGELPRVLRDDGIFGERCGVFVTLHVLERLRGCIGVVDTPGDPTDPAHPIEPLGSSLLRCAASAALSDVRFPPLRQEELSALQIEISLLSSPQPIRPEQIEIGRHGLLVLSAPPSHSQNPSRHGLSVRRGLLLPQVAVEHNLTVEEFLAETCRKAGLPSDAWRMIPAEEPLADTSPTQLFGFTCQIFSERDAPLQS